MGITDKVKSVVKGTMITGLSIHFFNKIFHEISINENIADNEGTYYKGQFGDIFYKVSGEGDPILLVHRISPEMSSYEWDNFIPYLSKDHKVFALDLPGCGFSDKDELCYTDFFYSKVLEDFARNIIKDPCTVITSGNSAIPVIIMDSFNDKVFNKIACIDPPKIAKSVSNIGFLQTFMAKLIKIPVVGTFLYDFSMTESSIRNKYTLRYFKNRDSASIDFCKALRESAQLGSGRGRFLFASLISGNINSYLSSDIYQNISNLFIVRCSFKKLNKLFLKQTANAKELTLFDLGRLPHIEYPELLVKKFHDISLL